MPGEVKTSTEIQKEQDWISKKTEEFLRDHSPGEVSAEIFSDLTDAVYEVAIQLAALRELAQSLSKE